jgi:hypothetical protein
VLPSTAAARRAMYSVSIKTITCPDCGLVVRVTRDVPDFKYMYDVIDWKRLCVHPDRGDPVLCLLLRPRPIKKRRISRLNNSKTNESGPVPW